jgi:hypothetical protein
MRETKDENAPPPSRGKFTMFSRRWASSAPAIWRIAASPRDSVGLFVGQVIGERAAHAVRRVVVSADWILEFLPGQTIDAMANV